MRRTVILHVTESYGAGTATAIQRFVHSVPEAEHHLLRRVRADSSINGNDDAFVSVSDLPASGPLALRAIRRVTARVDPTAVHLHSSIGGALGRTALRPSRRRSVVYSPHCYAFERRDLHPLARAGVRLVERLLSFNTTTTAACSLREVELARGLRPGAQAVLVPNVAPLARLTTSPSANAPTVVTIGRANAQKDPVFFAEVVSAVREIEPTVRFIWIGGGDSVAETTLTRAGVEVTGWLADADSWPVIPQDAVYLHTAAWEGYPLAILEAQAAGLPVVARRIPALAHVPEDLAAPDARGLASRVTRLLMDQESRDHNRRLWATEVAPNSPEQQRLALLGCYGLDDLEYA